MNEGRRKAGAGVDRGLPRHLLGNAFCPSHEPGRKKLGISANTFLGRVITCRLLFVHWIIAPGRGSRVAGNSSSLLGMPRFRKTRGIPLLETLPEYTPRLTPVIRRRNLRNGNPRSGFGNRRTVSRGMSPFVA